METCKVCGTQFKKRAHNSLTCSKECARENHRRNNRKGGKNYNPNRDHGYEAVKTLHDKLDEARVCTPDPWKNLMLGILIVAKEENDTEYLEEFGELYEEAITCQGSTTISR